MTDDLENKKSELVVREGVFRRRILSISETLRNSPSLTTGIYIFCSLGILLDSAVWTYYTASLQLPHLFSLVSIVGLWLIMIAVTLLHEINSRWMAEFNAAKRNAVELTRDVLGLPRLNTVELRVSQGAESSSFPAESSEFVGRGPTRFANYNISNIRAFISALANNRFIMRVLGLFIATAVLSSVLRLLIQAVVGAGTLRTAIIYLAISLVFPVASILALKISRRLGRKRGEYLAAESGAVAVAKSTEPTKSDVIARSVSSFLMTRGSYLGAYTGLVTLIGLYSYGLIGQGVAGWLHASLLDSNIAVEAAPTLTTVYLVSGITAILFYLALSGILVRLSASFQILVNRVVIYGDSLIEALMETAHVRSAQIILPESNDGLRSILAALSWLLVSYLILFFLVAFCPGPLGDAINNWMLCCVRDANLDHFSLSNQANMRIFLASIFAGYGAVPFAVMSSVFLPPRKPKALIISEQGILCPNSLSNLAGFSPLKHWNDLRKVSMTGGCGSMPERIKLKLTYSWCDSIEIPIAKIKPAELAELLATADEHAPKCKFSDDVTVLRLKLQEETKSNLLVDAGKFSSTIFSPRKCGDYLNNNKYRVVRKLAGKALSTVYLARDTASDMHVVIKEYVLPTTALQRERMLLTFEREFAILSSLHHPGIASLKEMFEEKDVRYIVIEYVQGQDLRSLVERRGGRSERIVWRWSRAICEIMIFLHEHDPPVLHRDLTPDNLMEDADGNLKLIDFGAAHQFMEGVTGTLIGKQSYIAPEQLRGKPGTTSDIYSFGCTLYFLLVGKDPVALRQASFDHDFSVSERLRKLIEDCTNFDESKRIQSFREVLVRIDSVTADVTMVPETGSISDISGSGT